MKYNPNRKPLTEKQLAALAKGQAKRAYLCAKAQLGMILNRKELANSLTDEAYIAARGAFTRLMFVKEEEIL